MSVLRACCWMLLIGSVVGCHSDTKHGYLRGGPVLTLAGRPQLSLERVQTASFRPELPPSELARVRLERWPRSQISGQPPAEVWTAPSETNRVLSPQEAQLVEERTDVSDSQVQSVREPIEADVSVPPVPLTYRRPHLRIDALQGLKSRFASRLQSGRMALHENACGARDWCREFGDACQTRGCELQSHVTEVWDEANPQCWIDAACQTCGERSQQLSSTLRECTDDVSCPGWFQPTRQRFTWAGERFNGSLEGATESFSRVKNQFEEVTESLDELQPLSDYHPVVTLPKPDIRPFLRPILRTDGQTEQPADSAESEAGPATAAATGVIELPAPADLKTQHSAEPPAESSAESLAEEEPSDTEAETPSDADAQPAEKPDGAVKPASAEVEVSGRRAIRKTDRWKSGLSGR